MAKVEPNRTRHCLPAGGEGRDGGGLEASAGESYCTVIRKGHSERQVCRGVESALPIQKGQPHISVGLLGGFPGRNGGASAWVCPPY